MSETMRKCGEIFVECGYALSLVDWDEGYILRDAKYSPIPEKIQPFTDTLEGRKQDDVIEDFLYKSKNSLWAKSYFKVDDPIITGESNREFRIRRMKWCIEQLCKDKDNE